MNMQELEKIDELKKRMNVTYTEAKEALEQCGDDLVEALIYLEKKQVSTMEALLADENEKEQKWDKQKTEGFVRSIIDQIKALIQEGNVTKVRLINGDKKLIEIPATIGVVGLGVVLFSPLLLAITALGAATAFLKEMAFEVEKADGTIERRDLKFPGVGSKKEACCEDEECCDNENCCDEAEAECSEDEEE